MEIVGQLNEMTLICTNNSSLLHEKSYHQLFILNINNDDTNYTKSSSSQLFRNTLQPYVQIPNPNKNSQIIQVSCQQLQNTQLLQDTILLTEEVTNYSLMTVVYQRSDNTGELLGNSFVYYSLCLFLLQEKSPNTVIASTASNCTAIVVIEKLNLIPEQNAKLNAHIMPCEKTPEQLQTSNNYCNTKGFQDLPTPTPTGRTFPRTFLNRILVLHLEESITIYRIETMIPAKEGPPASPTMEILSSELIPKYFRWAQWNPAYQFLAFVHKQKVAQSPTATEIQDADYRNITIPSAMNRNKKMVDIGILSIYQFHATYPRESVLNFPLPKYEEEKLTRKQEFFKPTCHLAHNPFVLTSTAMSSQLQLRVIAHALGPVYVFQLQPPSMVSWTNSLEEADKEDTLNYTVNILHHNKFIIGQVPFRGINAAVNVDLCLLMNGQLLAIVGWPLFIHILDVGADHDPSHHILLDLPLLRSLLLSPSTGVVGQSFTATATDSLPPVFMLSLTMAATTSNEIEISEKTTNNHVSCSLKLIFNNLQIQEIELNSSSMLSLIKSSDTQFKLNALHFLILHLNDANAAKRMIYDACQLVSNVWLSKLFQEFIIVNSFNQTKKQLLPNVKKFLHHLPYCPFNNFKENYEGLNYKIHQKTSVVQVSTMLLSPNQRIFPHNVTDLWTTLWELNGFLTKNKRFSHKTIADKLLVSLQCYKPEMLSRASTPMSPSSPMIWSSGGNTSLNVNGGVTSGSNSSSSLDMFSPFGRRTQELQLPFIEHESCTANKQEYVYSINLRELSMHLLKERKDCPVHGHTVSGKYVNALLDTTRLLCHLICLSSHLHQPTKPRDKGFRLIDTLNNDTKLRLFLLFEHFSLAMEILAVPMPNGFASFFAYLGYRVLQFDQFLWHARSGSFELQIDLVKTIMADLNDSDETNVEKKLHLISLLSKSRASRVLNNWSHPIAICIRARQHSSDLLTGSMISHARRSHHHHSNAASKINRNSSSTQKSGESSKSLLESEKGPIGTFFKLLSAKANPSNIDFALLTEATMVSMNK